MTGLSDSEIQQTREARSASPRNAAALQFARELVAKRGRATDADVEAVRRAGFSDGEIAEIIAHVALDIFTKLFQQHGGSGSRLSQDFPAAKRLGSRRSRGSGSALWQRYGGEEQE